MRQERNQSHDQKKGSADCDVTGSKKGMPGGDIGRNSMSGSDSQATRHATGKSDYGGSEGNSRERKSARNGSDSSES
jgi:hypothetical protein